LSPSAYCDGIAEEWTAQENNFPLPVQQASQFLSGSSWLSNCASESPHPVEIASHIDEFSLQCQSLSCCRAVLNQRVEGWFAASSFCRGNRFGNTARANLAVFVLFVKGTKKRGLVFCENIVIEGRHLWCLNLGEECNQTKSESRSTTKLLHSERLSFWMLISTMHLHRIAKNRGLKSSLNFLLHNAWSCRVLLANPVAVVHEGTYFQDQIE